MKKALKIALCIVAGLLALVMLVTVVAPFLFFRLMVILDDDRAPKEKIFSFVREQQEELEACIASGNFSTLDSSGVVMDVHVGENHVEFYCGGQGFGPDTEYRGFYYSTTNDMTVLYPDIRLKPVGNGYTWSGDGDNSYYTEHICGHFFYYELAF